MAIRRLSFGIVTLAAAPIFLGHCGSATPTDNPAVHEEGGTVDAAHPDAGQCEGTEGSGDSGAAPAEHRAQPVVCQQTHWYGDAGAPSCTQDADCQNADGGTSGLHCLEGHCGVDECLKDGDCAMGNSCVCGPDNGTGDRLIFNVCVPGNCRVDSDCGSGGFCMPSAGYCGSVSGTYCRTSADTCRDPTTDCSSCGECSGGAFGLNSPCNACVYAPQVGHWACGASICAG